MTELRKTGESSYEVVVDGRTIGQVWNWHGSWSAKTGAETSHNLKSRKRAIEHVKQAHRRDA